MFQHISQFLKINDVWNNCNFCLPRILPLDFRYVVVLLDSFSVFLIVAITGILMLY